MTISTLTQNQSSNQIHPDLTANASDNSLVLSKLTALASAGSAQFKETMQSVFGNDIPDQAYESLRQDILQGKCPKPSVEVSYANLGHALAAYDQSEAKILLSPELAYGTSAGAEALKQRAIAEETGHHIDNLLRNEYSGVGGDANLDEGAKFARDIVGLSVSNDEITQDGKLNGLEFFEAGGHKQIVSKAAIQVWRESNYAFAEGKSVQEIYFGNWLRDMSNAYDPQGVAKVAEIVAPHIQEDTAFLKALGFDETVKPSVDQIEKALTESLLHAISEGIRIEAKATFNQDITAKDIGAYSTVEHMDNPFSTVQQQLNQVDSASGISDHILESRDHMKQTLAQAFEAGYTTEGRALLGEATHTLEDLYAHSNYTEIAINRYLASQGKNASIEVWAPVVDIKGEQRPLLTTGGFGDLDIGYSLAPGLANALFSQKEAAHNYGEVMHDAAESWQSMLGGASESAPVMQHYDKIIKIVAEEKGMDVQGMIDTKNQLLAAFAPLKLLSPGLYTKVVNAINYAGSAAINGASEAIPLQQSIHFDANEQLPSHSQLAKDHGDHHFNSLASSLAETATKDVMNSMKIAWDLKAQGDLEGAQAAYEKVLASVDDKFVHPMDTTSQELMQSVAGWVENPINKGALTRGQYVSDLHHVVAELPGMDEQSATALLQSIAKGEPDTSLLNTIKDNTVDKFEHIFYKWFPKSE